MDPHWILSSPEHYARLNTYILEVGLPWSIEDFQNWEEAAPYLRGILGDARGQSALDCSCGWGTQAIPLAKLGWQVTACDVSETSLEFARKYASQEGVSVDMRICDMRDLAQVFNQQFDCLVTLYFAPPVLFAQAKYENSPPTLTAGGLCATLSVTRMRLPSWSSPRTGQSREAFHK